VHFITAKSPTLESISRSLDHHRWQRSSGSSLQVWYWVPLFRQGRMAGVYREATLFLKKLLAGSKAPLDGHDDDNVTLRSSRGLDARHVDETQRLALAFCDSVCHQDGPLKRRFSSGISGSRYRRRAGPIRLRGGRFPNANIRRSIRWQLARSVNPRHRTESQTVSQWTRPD
jgi:hypothetical protein